MTDPDRKEACARFMRLHHHIYFDACLPKDDPALGRETASNTKHMVLAVLPDGGFVKTEAAKLVITFQRPMARDEIVEVDASLQKLLKIYGLAALPQLHVDRELTGPYRPSNPRKLEHTRVEIAFAASNEQLVREMANELNLAYDSRHNEMHPVTAVVSYQLAMLCAAPQNSNPSSMLHP